MRTTVSIDDDLHRLSKLRTAAPDGGTLSEELNAMLRQAFASQLEEKERIDRALEEGRFVPLEDAVAELRRDGRL